MGAARDAGAPAGAAAGAAADGSPAKPARAPNPALLFDVLQEDDDSLRQAKLQRASIDIAPAATPRPPRRESAASSASGASAGEREPGERSPAGARLAASSSLFAPGGGAAGAAEVPGARRGAAAPQEGGRPGSGGSGSGGSSGAPPLARIESASTLSQDSCGAADAPAAGDDPTSTQLAEGQHAPQEAAAEQAAAAAAAHHSMTPAEVLEELLGPLYIDSGNLRMGELLGQGGFAEVRRATHRDPSLPGFEEPVAVKTLRPDVLRCPQELREFLAEANLLRKMAHPHIVRLRGVGAADMTDLVSMRESMIVVQELMAGGDLKQLVMEAMTRPFDPPYTKMDALRWVMQIAEAMHYLHGVCRPMIIHRDLKLDNILLTGGPVHDAQAKLADFGLHKRVRAILQSGLALPWAQDISLVGDACEKSYYGGNMYASAVGAESGPSMRRVASTGKMLSRVSEDDVGARDKSGALSGPGAGGAAAAAGGSGSGSGGGSGRGRPAPDIATQVLSGAGAGDGSMSRGRSRPGAPGGGADAAAAAADFGREPSVHRRLAAVQALEGSVRAGNVFTAMQAAAAAGGAGDSGRGGQSSLRARGGAGSARGVMVDATQKVGSLIYMAPEVVKGGSYSEKVDVFSFGVMLYELFSCALLASRVTMGMPDETGGEGLLAAFAQKVSEGHREDMPGYWPQPLKSLVASCWAQDPDQRPSFKSVLQSLYDMKRAGVAENLEAVRPRGNYNPTTDCGCSIM